MNIHEFGKENKTNILLLHPSLVKWDYYGNLIPILEDDYHLIVPALPGYDSDEDSDFTSIEQIVDELTDFLIANRIETIDLIYGCSMGGSIVLRMLINQKLNIKYAICDAGITPYKLPWIITKGIAIRDFLMVSIGKFCGPRILEIAFSTDEYSSEDLRYVSEVLKFISYRTIWRTFESCNNYDMPNQIPEYKGKLYYWYGEKEIKDRKWDINYVKNKFPNAEFTEFKNMGHASMASLHSPEMAKRIIALLEN